MLINFKCVSCGAFFSIDDSNIFQVDSLYCPACDKRVPDDFVNRLKDFCLEKNSTDFTVTFSAVPEIDSLAIRHGLEMNAIVALGDKFKIKSSEDFAAAYNSEYQLKMLVAMIEGAIDAYHSELRKTLLLSGIEIGEM